MKRIHTTLLALVATTVVAASGCYTVEANLPGTLRKDAKPTATVGKVSIEQTNWFFLWGLVGKPPADFFSTEIRKQVQAKGGDGVANLTYESQDGCMDMFIGAVTAGCVAPRSYKLTGDIVRIDASPIPGKPVKTSDLRDTAPIDSARLAQSY